MIAIEKGLKKATYFLFNNKEVTSVKMIIIFLELFIYTNMEGDMDKVSEPFLEKK